MGEVNGHTAILGRWLERLRDGDEAARSEVINYACQRLEALTRRMLRHYLRLRRWEQTGDVLQNALVRLHRSLATVRPESPTQFYGLAAAQIRRELTDLARHHFGPEGAAAHHHTDGAEQAGGPVVNKADPGGEPSTLAEWTEFHEKVQRLPQTEREVFDLLWYEGLTQAEAAQVLAVTERTVKNRWRSAKLELQRLLGEGPSE
ncbi:MAG TPA: sigma-70 family RNA polymerase sigma factor [Gemmataceae bacterium]|jgi:RNA polymerase sigma-70 factor (ECF subfamily)